MSKAGWLFSKNAGTGTEEDPNRPSLDAVGGRWTSPGDIIRLTGPSGPNAHHHLLVGGIGSADDNLVGEAGEGHKHYVLKINDVWQQVTVGATDHTHILKIGEGDNLIPEWYMVFWAGSDADAATLVADADNHIIVEGVLDEDDNIGDLVDTPWTQQEQDTWDARILTILGIQLPEEVDRGKRLVQIFLGALLSRHTSEERGYRFS